MSSYRPGSLKEALGIRADIPVRPFAGGTDLMVRYRAKNGMPPTVPGDVLFVGGIPELRGIRLTDEYLEIGASLPMAVIADDPGERAAYVESAGNDTGRTAADALSAVPEVLRAAAGSLGAPALRQRATLAGNLANASPAGDSVAALYALDAQVILASMEGERVLPVSEFITGPGRTILADNELITAIRIPSPLPDWGYWRKVGTRRANALTKVSLAASGRVEAGRVTGFTMAFGAVGPVIIRVPEAEKLLIGKTAPELDGPAVKELERVMAEAAAPHITPIDDQRSTAEYRKTVALNLIGEGVSSLALYLKENNK
jgi:CO/xanthine dehydrogenase FAD-binding subunit